MPSNIVIKGKHIHIFKDQVFNVDMFYKEVYWEEVSLINDKFIHRTWRFNRSDFACLTCGKYLDIEFNIQSQGVYAKCMYCKVTFPAVVFDPETNENFAELVLSEEVTIPEAQKILERTGQDSEWLAPYVQRPRPRERRVHLDEEPVLDNESTAKGDDKIGK